MMILFLKAKNPSLILRPIVDKRGRKSSRWTLPGGDEKGSPGASPGDAEYMAAVKRGDMAAAQKMVSDAAKAAGAQVFEAPDTVAFSVRRKPAPTKTEKRYKAFRMVDGKLRPLYVGAKDDIPMGVWLDAKAGGFRFRGKDKVDKKTGKRTPGNWYVTGGTGTPTRMADLPEESQRILRENGITTQWVPLLAYRPGWHTGTLPFNPQGAGSKDKGYKKGVRSAEHPYQHILDPDVVIAEVELSADENYQKEYERTAARDKKGNIKINESGLRRVPESGFYNYTTNSNNRELPGEWSIGGSLKINRLLTQEEADNVLDDAGAFRQLRSGGSLDLDKLGYDPKALDASGWALLDPVLKDADGEVIPLSRRFAPMAKSLTLFFKAHVSAYITKRGTPVAAHEDSRPSARPKLSIVQKKPTAEDRFEAAMAGKAEQDRRAFTAAHKDGIAIPPAWTAVTYYGPKPDNGIVARGIDAAGRRQIIEDPEFREARIVAKHARIERNLLPRMAEVEQTLKRQAKEGNDAALVLYLIMKTGFRIGGKPDGRAKSEAFGASSLLGKHVTVTGSTVHFQFPGKKGVSQDHTIKDAIIAKACRGVADDAQVFKASAPAIRRHWKSLGGEKVHDIRSAVATLTAAKTLRAMKPAKPATEKAFGALQREVATVVAAKLGNKPAEALKTYIDARVFERYAP